MQLYKYSEKVLAKIITILDDFISCLTAGTNRGVITIVYCPPIFVL